MDYNKFAIYQLALEPSLAYIRSILTSDWHALGSCLAAEFECASGTVETLLPIDFHSTSELNFKTGGATNSSASQKWISNVAFEFLSESENRVLLAQHPLARRGDIIIESKKPSPHFFGSDVYYVCDSASSREDVEAIFRYTDALPWSVAVLTFLPYEAHHRLLDQDSIEESLFQGLCHNANAVIIGGVYDDEGHLVWRRNL